MGYHSGWTWLTHDKEHRKLQEMQILKQPCTVALVALIGTVYILLLWAILVNEYDIQQVNSARSKARPTDCEYATAFCHAR